MIYRIYIKLYVRCSFPSLHCSLQQFRLIFIHAHHTRDSIQHNIIMSHQGLFFFLRYYDNALVSCMYIIYMYIIYIIYIPVFNLLSILIEGLAELSNVFECVKWWKKTVQLTENRDNFSYQAYRFPCIVRCHIKIIQ